MQLKKTLRAAVIPSLILEIGGNTYTIEYPLPAVMAAEEKLGRSLKTPVDWFGIRAKDVPVLLEAGLKTHHPEMTEAGVAEICNHLNAELYTEITEALGALNFPKWLEKYEAAIKEAAKTGAGGKPDPKA